MKDIKGYEGLYGVTSCGRIYSYRSKRFLKLQNDRYGYKFVRLFKNDKAKNCWVHRLVALAYIPNDDPTKTMINHKDECKSNNCINNLEWCDSKYNVTYSNGKKVQCIETGEIFNSLNEAAETKGTYQSSISRCLVGKYTTAANLHWRLI